MATFNKDDFISKLPEGLREQAEACNTAAELLELADKNDIELPAEALEAASGGCGEPRKCPHCGSQNVELIGEQLDSPFTAVSEFRCNSCFRTFKEY